MIVVTKNIYVKKLEEPETTSKYGAEKQGDMDTVWQYVGDGMFVGVSLIIWCKCGEKGWQWLD